jgi:hypothetical protein
VDQPPRTPAGRGGTKNPGGRPPEGCVIHLSRRVPDCAIRFGRGALRYLVAVKKEKREAYQEGLICSRTAIAWRTSS